MPGVGAKSSVKPQRGGELLVSGTRALVHPTPISLLAAAHEVVPFQGRGEILDALCAFCGGAGEVRVQLVHGAAGAGKTRLAIELCRRLRERGVRAGFVSDIDRIRELGENDEPVLAVIDHAEGVLGLGEEIRALAELAREKPLRILLLARTSGEWWSDLLREDGPATNVLRLDPPLALGSLELSREEIFRTAAHAFAERLDASPGDVAAPDLSDARHAEILYVHMAALAAVEKRSTRASELVEATLDREEQRWAALLREASGGERADAPFVRWMRHTVAAALLLGGLTSPDDVNPFVDNDPLPKALANELYGGSIDPLQVEAMSPSLLGEAMTRRVLREPTASRFLDTLFEDVDERTLVHGFMVLGRVTDDEGSALVTAMMERHTAARALAALAAAARIDEDEGTALAAAAVHGLREGRTALVEEVARALSPADATVARSDFGEWVVGYWHAPTRRTTEPPDADRAALLAKVGGWQKAFERDAEAQETLWEAAAEYRALAAAEYPAPAAAEPSALRARLAAVLHELGDTQDGLDRAAAAESSFEEAIRLWRDAAASRPDTYLNELAESLEALSSVQDALQRAGSGVALQEEAVALRRRAAEAPARSPYRMARSGARAAEPSDEPRWVLAWSLVRLGERRRSAGDAERAEAPILEALTLHSSVPESPSEAHLMAYAKTALSEVQHDLGRPESTATATAALDACWPAFVEDPSEYVWIAARVLDVLREQLEARGEAPSPELRRRIELVERELNQSHDRRLAQHPHHDALLFEEACRGELSQAHHAALARVIADTLGDPGQVESGPTSFVWLPSEGREATGTHEITVHVADGQTLVRIKERRRKQLKVLAAATYGSLLLPLVAYIVLRLSAVQIGVMVVAALALHRILAHVELRAGRAAKRLRARVRSAIEEGIAADERGPRS